MFLALKPVMAIFIYCCERCQEYFSDKSYRVSSENDGQKLLDMVVCYGCYIEASRLGLDTESVEIGQIALH
jgi:hypothetical protein